MERYGDILLTLDELNSSGRIQYEDYSRLHDEVSTLLNEMEELARYKMNKPMEDIANAWFEMKNNKISQEEYLKKVEIVVVAYTLSEAYSESKGAGQCAE